MRNVYRWYALARWLHEHHVPVLPRAITLLIRLIFGGYIPHQAKIGKGTKIGYGGIGVVIHNRCTIGRDCTISQGVTLGVAGPADGVPHLGDRVDVGAGAKVLGDVRLGDNCIIGANAVVTKDVPANAVAAGVPAKVMRKLTREELAEIEAGASSAS
jgi:serine O-acetyltransferase